MRSSKKIIIAFLVFALCISTVGVTSGQAASRPAKPKFKVTKRAKKSATLKVQNSKGVTGYRIYLRVGKKGKWKLYDFALHSSKITVTKLKSGKTYYVKLKAWKTKGHSVRLSRYSKTVKIGKYQKKQSPAGVTPAPTSVPTVVPDTKPATESAITVVQ